MSTVSTSKDRYENIRCQKGPVGVACPQCHNTNDIYYSSAQLRRPLHKRMFYSYLRCHACTHRFRTVRVGTLVFVAVATVIFLFAGVLG